MDHSRRWLAELVLGFLALVGAACGVSSGDDAPAPEATEDTDTPPDPVAGDGVLDSRAVLEQMRGSVALIVTPTGTGSSVLIDDG